MNPRRVATLLRELADALEEDEAEDAMPYVCPGCHAVGGEPCAPGCIDDEIRRDAENELEMQDRWLSEDNGG